MTAPARYDAFGVPGRAFATCDTRARPALFILLLAAAVLALEPVAWLVNTWRDPVYQSDGLLVAALIAALAAWSLSSPIVGTAPAAARALPLLAVSAVTRLAGQVSAINVIGAMTLIVDVYALALLVRLGQRQRPVSPAWLAIAFAFSLPLERMVQRSLGFGLQQLSADGACALLGTVFDSVRCEGIRILLDGRDVLVDLPCSGARTLLLTALAFTLAAAVVRPRPRDALIGAVVMLAAAVFANTVRISVLAVGIAFPDMLGGIDVMAEPWHDAIGYLALAGSLAPLVVVLRHYPRGDTSAAVHTTDVPTIGAHAGIPRHFTRFGGLLPALVALLVAILIVNLPRRAIDMADADTSLSVPAWIGGRQAAAIAISEREATYFTTYGGAAAKASYGASSLMLVRTTSPLRHLHAPDECLRGLGFDVAYRGLSFEPLPTAHYIATDPGGRAYRVDVSFASSNGHVTGSVAVAVWYWLKRDARQWTAIQRISPVELPLAEHQSFSAAALFALGIEPQATPATARRADDTQTLPLSLPPPLTAETKG